jgi:hypothetical protein
MQAADACDLLGSWLLQSQQLFGAKLPASIAISREAISNARGTFDLAMRAHWRRRAAFIADQLRFSFARETLAKRYGKPLSRVSVTDAGRHAAGLLKLHRGRWLRRLIGRTDRPS